MSDIAGDPVRTVNLSPCASTVLNALIMKRGGALDRDLVASVSVYVMLYLLEPSMVRSVASPEGEDLARMRGLLDAVRREGVHIRRSVVRADAEHDEIDLGCLSVLATIVERQLGDVLSPRSMRTVRAFAKTNDDTLDGAI